MRNADPLTWPSRALTKLHTLRLRLTYPFHSFGKGVSIHHSCDLVRSRTRRISLGDFVYLAPHVWLNVVDGAPAGDPAIVIGHGCSIGRRSTISAQNSVLLEPDVLLAPSVLIMDHNHEYSDPTMPIHAQGVTAGGSIVIQRNCWLGHGAVIVSGQRDLVLGRNSVIGANAVVTRTFPPYSVIAGNPAKLIRRYDPESRRWVRASAETQ